MGRETYTGDVAFEVRGHLGLITLNRPKALNALTQLMCESILIQLQDWAEDNDVAQVLIRGAGSRGLCAGGDIASVYRDMVEHQPRDGSGVLPEAIPGYRSTMPAEDFFSTEYRMNLVIAEYPKSYIALMDRVVLGGGVGVSAHGSHRIVTERSRVGMPETSIGFSPDVGGTYLLARAPGASGLHLGLTGAHLNAADAIHAGLADVFVPTEDLEKLTKDLTEGAADEVLGRYQRQPGEASLAQDAEWIERAYAADVAGTDAVETIFEQLQQLSGDFKRAGESLAELQRKSPTMLKVARRAISHSASLTLPEALSQEHIIAQHALRSHDFREGIRAQVIDKDRSPRWNPGSIHDVEDGLVSQYFTPVPGSQPLFA